MKKLKIIQDWPLLHNGKALNRGDVAEFDDKYADWLLAHGRAEADKSLKRAETIPPRLPPVQKQANRKIRQNARPKFRQPLPKC